MPVLAGKEGYRACGDGEEAIFDFIMGAYTWGAGATEHRDICRSCRGTAVEDLRLFGVNTLLRLQGGYEPEAELMGLFGFVALGINIASTLVLLPHRSGDANARSVWLFSRNDAIGNLAVVVAAGIVAWSGTEWPDVVVALVISVLFLHSAWSIIRDSLHDLGEAAS